MDSDDVWGEIVGFILIATAVILAVITVVAAFLSFLIGNFVNILIRIIFGWTLNEKSNSGYIGFATISILIFFPITIWIGVIILGLSTPDWFLKIVVILCSFMGLAGYYANHFKMSPDKFASFNAFGIMKVHEQEAKWFNSTRTNWYVFWHWTVAKQVLKIDMWFKDNVTRRITG